MRKYLVLLALIASGCASADQIKISELPLGSGAAAHGADVFPFVDSATGITKKMQFSDFINVPALIAAFGTPTLSATLLNGNSAGASAINMNGQQVLRLRAENLSVDPAFGSSGRMWFNTTTQQWKGDTGSSIVPIGGATRTIQGSFGAPITLTNSGQITAINARNQLVYIVGSGGAVNIASVNPQITAGFSDGDEMQLMGVNAINTVAIGNGNGVVWNGLSKTFGLYSTCTINWVAGPNVWVQKGWCNDL